jgi:phage FluMu protein Com
MGKCPHCNGTNFVLSQQNTQRGNFHYSYELVQCSKCNAVVGALNQIALDKVAKAVKQIAEKAGIKVDVGF